MTRLLYQAIAVLLPNPHALDRSTQHARDEDYLIVVRTARRCALHGPRPSRFWIPMLKSQALHLHQTCHFVPGAEAETLCNPRSLSNVEPTGIPSTCIKEELRRRFDVHKGANSRIYCQYHQCRNCFSDSHPCLQPTTGLPRNGTTLLLDLRTRSYKTTSQLRTL